MKVICISMDHIILKNPGKAGTIISGAKRPNVQIKEIWI